jgi:hypothetical protein
VATEKGDKKGGRTQGASVQRTPGLHELDSGLIHTMDSNAGGPEGTFIDRFGPPGNAAQGDNKLVPTQGPYGKEQKAPRLATRFLRGGGSKQ